MRTNARTLPFALLALCLTTYGQASDAGDSAIGTTAGPRLTPDFGNMPLLLECNEGQFDEQVSFAGRGAGYQLFLTKSADAVLVFRAAAGYREGGTETAVVRMSLKDASNQPVGAAEQEAASKIHYMKGAADQWRTAATYEAARFRGVYDGIDLVYYGNQQRLQYDFVVAPGSDPSVIALNFDGVEKLELGAEGELLLHTPLGTLRQKAPYTYQEIDGEKREIASAFRLAQDGSVGFDVGGHDPAHPLVIDPILTYVSVVGGSDADVLRAVAAAPDGGLYFAGKTHSTDFPMVNPIAPTARGGTDVLVGKLNAAGTALEFATYLGGRFNDEALSMAADSAGNIYITGATNSTDDPGTPLYEGFPFANAYQPFHSGAMDDGEPVFHAFLAKLNPQGSTLLYSTYYGASYFAGANGVAADDDGNAFITGSVWPGLPSLPARNGYKTSPPEGDSFSRDAFLAHFDTNASGDASLIYSTFFGGSVADSGVAIAISAGVVYVMGDTYSEDLPLRNPYQSSNGGGFVAKFNTAASGDASLLYSSYFGGANNDSLLAMTVVGSHVILTGGTNSTDFPVKDGFQASVVGGGGNFTNTDAFVSRFDTAVAGAGALIYSTLHGGGGNEYGYSIVALDDSLVAVTGWTSSNDFPLTNALQTDLAGDSDAFVAIYDTSAIGEASRVFSTYLGGPLQDRGHGIAVDGSGNLLVGGLTKSGTLAGVTPAGIGPRGEEDIFLVKIDLSEPDTQPPVIAVIDPQHNSAINQFATLSGTATDPGGSGIAGDVVNIRLRHLATGDYWQGNAWGTGATFLVISVNPETGTWTRNASLPNADNETLRDGEYQMVVTTVDNAENQTPPEEGINDIRFTVDRQPPEVTITSPEDGATITEQIFPFQGTASDNHGIDSVIARLRRNSDGMYWDGTGWVDVADPANPVEANLTTSYSDETEEWNCTANRPIPGYPPNNMPNGSYTYIAIAIDHAGNPTQTESQVVVEYRRVMKWEGLYSTDWDNPANWHTTGLGAGLVVPDENTIVIIDSNRSVTVNGSRSIFQLRMSDGHLHFTSSNSAQRVLTTLDTSTWSGGRFTGIWNIPRDAVVDIVGPQVKFVSDGSVINNFGRMSWGGPGTIQAQGEGYVPNPVINNKADGVFEVKGGGAIFSRWSSRDGTPVFNNEPGSLFRRSAPPADGNALIGPNLIENPGAEAGGGASDFSSTVSLPGWSTSGTFTAVKYSIGGSDEMNPSHSTAYGGGANYFAGGPGTGVSSATQTIDVSDIAQQIDTGLLRGTLEGMFGGYLAEGDHMSINAVFRDDRNVVIASLGAGPVQPSDRNGQTSLLHRSSTSHIPIGTRTIEFRLSASLVTGDYNDGYADNLSFTISGTGSQGEMSVIDIWLYNNSGEMLCEEGRIAFNTAAFFTDAEGMSGAGVFEQQGGNLTVTGDFVLEDTVFRLDQGNFMSATGAMAKIITVGNGMFHMRGGGLSRTIELSEGSRFQFVDPESGPNIKWLADGLTFINRGIIQWMGGGMIMAQGEGYSPNPVISNKTDSRFEMHGDGQIFTRWSFRDGNPQLINEPGAKLIKTGGDGILTLNTFHLTNLGEMRVDTGKLALNTQAACGLGSTHLGPGSYELVGGKLSLTGIFPVSNGATFTFLGGEIVPVNSPDGVQLVAPAGKLRFQGGHWYGKWTVPEGGFLEISDAEGGAVTRWLRDGFVLNNFGTVTWKGGAPILVQGEGYSPNPVINNKPDGRFEAEGDGTLFTRWSMRDGIPVFNNEQGATFVKSGGVGTLLLNTFHFTNRGSVASESGVVAFNTKLDHLSAIPFSGTGAFEFINGRLELNGALRVRDTSFAIRAGDIVADANGSASFVTDETSNIVLLGGRYFGKFTLPEGSELELNDPPEGPVAKFFGDGSVFDNFGTFTIAGEGTLQADGWGHPNLVFNNNPGGLFRVLRDGPVFSRAQTRDGTPVFNNAANAQVLTQSDGPTEWRHFALNNAGQITCNSGVIDYMITAALNHDTLLDGDGPHQFTGGILNLSGSITTAGVMRLWNADVRGNGAGGWLHTTGTGVVQWMGGVFRGNLALAQHSVMQVLDRPGEASLKFLHDGLIFENHGTITWTGDGHIQAEGQGYVPNPVFRNMPTGTFNAAPALGRINRWSYRDGTPLFTNNGLLNIGASPGMLSFEGWNFTQSFTGALNVEVAGPSISEFDRLNLANRGITLGGSLHVSKLNGYEPEVGTTFDFLISAGRTGTFSHIYAPDFAVDYTAGGATLRAVDAELTYDTWALAAGLTGPNSLPVDDFDGDGKTNFAEYVFNTDPKSGNAAPESFSIETINGQKWLVLNYRRWEDREAAGVVYTPEGSPALDIWDGIGVIDEVHQQAPIIAGSLARRCRVPIGGEKRFLHIRANN